MRSTRTAHSGTQKPQRARRMTTTGQYANLHVDKGSRPAPPLSPAIRSLFSKPLHHSSHFLRPLFRFSFRLGHRPCFLRRSLARLGNGILVEAEINMVIELLVRG
jgi:hypothetical protein